jgi:hypothetical protein
MPVIGTSGSLSISKALTAAGNVPTENWIMQFNDAGYTFQNLITSNNNQILSAATYNNSSDPNNATNANKFYQIKINQANGLPNITSQTTSNGSKQLVTAGKTSVANNTYYYSFNFQNATGLGGNSSAGTIIATIDGDILYNYENTGNISATGSLNRRTQQAVIANSVNDYWITGIINQSSNAGNLYKIYLTNFNSNTKSTDVVFNESGNGASTGSGSIIKYASDGNILIFTEYRRLQSYDNFFSLLKFNTSNNTVIWEQRYAAANTQFFGGDFIDGNDGYVYAVYNLGFNANATNQGLYLYKYQSNNGVLSSNVKYSNGSSFLNSTISKTNSNIIITLDNTANTYILNVNDNGNINWQRSISNTPTVFSHTIKSDDLYIAAQARQPNGNATSRSSIFYKFPANGTILGNGVYSVHANLTINYANTNTFTKTSNSIGVALPTGYTVNNAVNTTVLTLNNTSNTTFLNTTILNI